MLLAGVALLIAGYFARARSGRRLPGNPLNEFDTLEPLLANYSGPDEVEDRDANAGF